MYKNMMIQADDDASVATKITSNTASSRRNCIQRWGPPILVFSIASILISKDSAGNGKVSSTLLRSFNGHRELYSPYDKSTTVDLPTWTNSLTDVWEPFTSSSSETKQQGTPFFWYIPKSGGSTINDVFSHCLGLTLASNKGMGNHNDTLGVYESVSEHEQEQYPHNAQYVNVKTSNQQGIEKCKERGLLESGLADVFTTQHMTFAAQNMFTETHKGRGFVMMRHPVKRVIDQFLSRQELAKLAVAAESKGKSSQQQLLLQQHLADMSLEDFATSSDQFMNNFEVRMLNGITDFTTPITDVHLAMAKEILRRKFVVGIYEWFDVGMVRFEKYFGWWKKYSVLNNVTINNCHYSIIESGSDQVSSAPKVESVEKVYTAIMTRSWADMELYHYAKTLFAEQAKLL